MSASTGTIQRPMAGGSIVGAVAIGVATLFAVGALAVGAMNLTATKQAATPVQAPQYLDRGGRELAAPVVGKAATPFDINTAHAVPWVERNGATLIPFDINTAHAVPWVERTAP